MNEGCQHTWVYGGLRYRQDDGPLPGSGAYARIYSDWFSCSSCLAEQHRNERRIGNTYQKPIDGAEPQ